MTFIGSSESTESQQWSETIFLGTMRNAAHSSSSYNDDYLFDNASNTFGVMCCEDCPDERVMMVALRWAKLFVLKVGRMYYGAPVCLMLVPVVLGIAIGYMMGTRADTATKTSRISLMASLWRSAMTILQHIPMLTFWLSFRATFGSQVLTEKEVATRKTLRSERNTDRESGVPIENVPRHVAVIMDGNRRYGRSKYGNATQVSTRNNTCCHGMIRFRNKLYLTKAYFSGSLGWKQDTRGLCQVVHSRRCSISKRVCFFNRELAARPNGSGFPDGIVL